MRTTKDIDLSEIKSTGFNSVIHINIYHTNVNKIHFPYGHFSLSFPKNISYDERSNIYTKLLKSYKSLGMTSSYNKLYIEYQKYKHTYNNRDITNYIS